MEVFMQSDILHVTRPGYFSYPIVFQEDFCKLGDFTAACGLDGKKVLIVCDSNVEPLYLDPVKQQFLNVCDDVSTFVFPAGESSKNLKTVSDLYEVMVREKLDRRSVLAALGGGVTGDITGFAAATYMRGIRYIQIPTSLLAQVDSSVGGKTGVDFEQYKNIIGAFWQPTLVYMSFSALSTLPDREFKSGMGELLKTGLICDGDFFRQTVKNADLICAKNPRSLAGAVKRCCEVKSSIVAKDPEEKTGIRALLNLGHTIGHAVEKLKGFELSHGQCVALGLCAAAFISKKRGLMSEEEYQEIMDSLDRFGLQTKVVGLQPDQVLYTTRMDKKMENGRIRFVLMKGIGNSFTDATVTDQEIHEAICSILEDDTP